MDHIKIDPILALELIALIFRLLAIAPDNLQAR